MNDTPNPWKTLSGKDIYDNAWIAVSEHDVITPTGSSALYGKVSFKNIACGIIPLDEAMNTWIVGQHRYVLDLYSWEIPMGGVPRDESPLEGARRELREETGLTAAHWTKILDVHISNSITDEVGQVFVAEGLSEGETDFDHTEDLQIRKLPFRHVLGMVLDGEITDLLSVAGVLKLATERGITR